MRSTTLRVASRALLAALVGASAPLAQAATDSTTFTTTATVLSDCNLSATDLAFGNYDASSGSPLDATSTVAVYCTLGTSYALSLSVGTGGGSFTTRTLANGINTLGFNLYTSAAHSTVWGDGTGPTNTISGSGAGLLTASNHTVYGRISTGQAVAIGAYASVVTVTVTF